MAVILVNCNKFDFNSNIKESKQVVLTLFLQKSERNCMFLNENFNRKGRKEFLFYKKRKERKALLTLKNIDKEI